MILAASFISTFPFSPHRRAVDYAVFCVRMKKYIDWCDDGLFYSSVIVEATFSDFPGRACSIVPYNVFIFHCSKQLVDADGSLSGWLMHSSRSNKANFRNVIMCSTESGSGNNEHYRSIYSFPYANQETYCKARALQSKKSSNWRATQEQNFNNQSRNCHLIISVHLLHILKSVLHKNNYKR